MANRTVVVHVYNWVMKCVLWTGGNRWRFCCVSRVGKTPVYTIYTRWCRWGSQGVLVGSSKGYCNYRRHHFVIMGSSWRHHGVIMALMSNINDARPFLICNFLLHSWTYQYLRWARSTYQLTSKTVTSQLICIIFSVIVAKAPFVFGAGVEQIMRIWVSTSDIY